MSLNIKPINIVDGETIFDDLFGDIDNNFTKVKLEVDSLAGDVNNLLSGGTIKNELDIVIARADKDIADLNGKFTKVDITKAELDILSASATESKFILEPLTKNATIIKDKLIDANAEANILNVDLVGKNSVAQTTKAELRSEINTADEKLQEFKNYDTTELVPKANTMLNDMYCNKELLSINHNLNGYPIVQLTYTEFGAGIGGAGDYPAGGDSENLMQNKIIYNDKNSLTVYVPSNYYFSIPSINKLSNYQYIITFADSTKSILLDLINNNVTSTVTTLDDINISSNSSYGEYSMSANQSISGDATATTISLNTETKINPNTTLISNGIKVLQTGTYMIMNTFYLTVASGNRYIQLFKNDMFLKKYNKSSFTNDNSEININDLLDLEENDVLIFKVMQSSGNSVNIPTDSMSFKIKKVG